VQRIVTFSVQRTPIWERVRKKSQKVNRNVRRWTRYTALEAAQIPRYTKIDTILSQFIFSSLINTIGAKFASGRFN
jgi:hypothetical protein